MAVISTLDGKGGAGKTASEVHFLVTQFLPYERGVYWSNLPLDVDAIVKVCLRKHKKKLTEEEIRRRVRAIPEDEFRLWMQKKDRHPADFIRENEITCARFVIDEAHLVATTRDAHQWRDRWSNLLGMIRHEDIEMLFISQHMTKLAKYIRDHAARYYSLLNHEDLKEYFSGIQWSHIYEIKGKIYGTWEPKVSRFVAVEVNGKRRTIERQTFTLGPHLYRLYNSYNKPHGDDEVEEEAPTRKYKFEQMGWGELLWWVLKSNSWEISKRFVLIAALSWLLMFGGKEFIMKHWISSFTNIAQNNSRSSQAKEKKDEILALSVSEEPPLLLTPEQQQEIEDMRAEIEAYRQEVDRKGQLSAVAPGVAFFQDGRRYRVGSTIPAGPLTGETVAEIDTDRRCVVLESGEVLWLDMR